MVVKTDTIVHSRRCQLLQQCHNTPGYKIERCTTCRNGRCDINLTSALSSSAVCQPCSFTVTITLATLFLICALGSLLSFCRMCASATGACLSVSNKKCFIQGFQCDAETARYYHGTATWAEHCHVYCNIREICYLQCASSAELFQNVKLMLSAPTALKSRHSFRQGWLVKTKAFVFVLFFYMKPINLPKNCLRTAD